MMVMRNDEELTFDIFEDFYKEVMEEVNTNCTVDTF